MTSTPPLLTTPDATWSKQIKLESSSLLSSPSSSLDSIVTLFGQVVMYEERSRKNPSSVDVWSCPGIHKVLVRSSNRSQRPQFDDDPSHFWTSSRLEVYEPPRSSNWDDNVPAYQLEVVLPLRFPPSCFGLFPHWILQPFICRDSAPWPRVQPLPVFRTFRILSPIQSIRACTTNHQSTPTISMPELTPSRQPSTMVSLDESMELLPRSTPPSMISTLKSRTWWLPCLMVPFLRRPQTNFCNVSLEISGRIRECFDFLARQHYLIFFYDLLMFWCD